MSSHEEAGFAKRRPISTHKAFAPIVALWFAALLGLGSMVLPVAQIERLVLLTGISGYIPIVAPPLDLTGRAIVAVVLALLGGAIGQVIARRLGAAHSGSANDEAEGETRAPISAHAELGDALDEEAPRRSRRLSVEDDPQEEQVIEFAPLPVAMMPDPETEEVSAEEPVFLPVIDECDELELVEEETEGDEYPVHEELDVVETSCDAFEQEPGAEFEEVPLAVETAPEAGPEPLQPRQIARAVSPFDDKPLEELGLVQLVERLGASMQRHRAMRANPAVAHAPAPARQPAPEPVLPQAETFDVEAEVETFDPEPPAPSFEEVPESEPAPAEYANDADPEVAAEAISADEIEVDVTLVEAETEVEVEVEEVIEETATEADPEPQPAAVNPFAGLASFAEEDDEEELASFADSFRLPIGSTPVSLQDEEDDSAVDATSSSFVDEEDDYDAEYEAEDEVEEEDEDDNEVYGSLLSLRRPFPPKPAEEATDQQSPWVNEEQEEAEETSANAPAPVSPGPETNAHERALRDALLSSLQRLDRTG